MKQVSANLTLPEALQQAEEMTEVRDDEGRLLCYVVTPQFGSKLKDERRAFYRHIEKMFPKEELEEARKSTKTYTTEDVLKLVEGD
jgi:hypothetical protein